MQGEENNRTVLEAIPHPEAVPFALRVSDEALQDLKRRIEWSRFPDEGPHEEWKAGTPNRVMQELRSYWLNKFNWRKQEKLLNSFPQYMMNVDLSTCVPQEQNLHIHFIHQRSTATNAIPLLMLHGWPGSVFEFHKVIDILAKGDGVNGFHVIAPSLPGYGFSEAPKSTGFDTSEIAHTMNALMLQIGYSEYVVQGGDWGAMVAKQIGILYYPTFCKAIHVNMLVAHAPRTPDGRVAGMQALSPREQRELVNFEQFRREELGYQQIQQTKPQSLGFAMNDSPVGLAAWITEKFKSWGDTRATGSLDDAFTFDELLTNISIYWFSGCITSSMRLYYETLMGRGRGSQIRKARCAAPTGCAVFPCEMLKPPRSWVALSYNIRQWTEFENGGHFAALEQPSALAQDVHKFFWEELKPQERPTSSGAQLASKL